jgi:hypothetical protein
MLLEEVLNRLCGLMNKIEILKRPVLCRIANVLGVPVEHFFVDPVSTRQAATEDECLRLWPMICTDAGRQQALEALRMIVDHERARAKP